MSHPTPARSGVVVSTSAAMLIFGRCGLSAVVRSLWASLCRVAHPRMQAFNRVLSVADSPNAICFNKSHLQAGAITNVAASLLGGSHTLTGSSMASKLKPGVSLGSKPGALCTRSASRGCHRARLLVLCWVKEKVVTEPLPQDGLDGLKQGKRVLQKASLRRRQAPGISNIAQFKRRTWRHTESRASADAVLQPLRQVPDTSRSSPLQNWPFPGAHKPLGLVAVSAHILGTACQLTGTPWSLGLPGQASENCHAFK